jgi:hypothetical protein
MLFRAHIQPLPPPPSPPPRLTHPPHSPFHQTTRYSGWLRLLVVTLLPLAAAVILVMVPLHFIRKREVRAAIHCTWYMDTYARFAPPLAPTPSAWCL